MVFAQRTRLLRWAGQPSTFYLLLNAVLLTGLIHYWSGWSLSSQHFAWFTAHDSLETDAPSASTLPTHLVPQTHAAIVPPPVPPPVSLSLPPSPPPVSTSAPPNIPPSAFPITSLANQLPGFCNLCGPEDAYCKKYGCVTIQIHARKYHHIDFTLFSLSAFDNHTAFIYWHARVALKVPTHGSIASCATLPLANPRRLRSSAAASPVDKASPTANNG